MFKLQTWSIVILLFLGVISCKNNAKKPFGKDPALEQKTWELMEMNGTAVSVPPSGKQIYLTFEGQGNTFGGCSGCNQCNGMYTTGDDMIKLHTMAVTQMACENMEQESQFLKVMEESNRYKLMDKKESGVRVSYLLLYKEEQLIAKFKAK